MRYPIAIETGTDTHAYGVVVPDLPGCFSAGDTLDEAMDNAKEAIELWLEVAIDDGMAIPEPSPLQAHQRRRGFKGWTWALVTVASQGLLRRINVLADKALLAAYAGQATRVERAHVERAVADSEFGTTVGGQRWPWALAMALCVVGALVWMLGLGREFIPRGASETPALAAPATAAPKVTTSPAAPPPVAAAPAPGLEVAPHAGATLYPQVSPHTGLVGVEHLRPAGLPAPDPRALLEKWGKQARP